LANTKNIPLFEKNNKNTIPHTLSSITVFAQYQYPTAEQLHNFQGGGGIGMPITGSLGEQHTTTSNLEGLSGTQILKK
jgi:hypothetical protein